MRAHDVAISVDDERGTADALTRLEQGLSAYLPQRSRRVGERLRARLEPPRYAVLDLLARVGLVDALFEEELQEAAVVLEPVVAVVLGPAFVGVELIVE